MCGQLHLIHSSFFSLYHHLFPFPLLRFSSLLSSNVFFMISAGVFFFHLCSQPLTSIILSALLLSFIILFSPSCCFLLFHFVSDLLFPSVPSAFISQHVPGSNFRLSAQSVSSSLCVVCSPTSWPATVCSLLSPQHKFRLTLATQTSACFLLLLKQQTYKLPRLSSFMQYSFFFRHSLSTILCTWFSTICTEIRKGFCFFLYRDAGSVK